MASNHISTGYDFVVCGAGSAGSVVAGRLAEDPAASVLLLEAGDWGNDDAVHDPERWQSNIGGDRNWSFASRTEFGFAGRTVPQDMGKVVGGGSAINSCLWMRGDPQDWDHVAEESGDPLWGAGPTRQLFRTIEDRDGRPGGKVSIPIQTWSRRLPDEADDPALAFLEAARSNGLRTFDRFNEGLVGAGAGAALTEVNIRDGRRQSLFDAYVRQVPRSNLTVLARATVTRIVFDRGRATHVEFVVDGVARSVEVATEVVVSAGAVQTPKLLMQSGIGEEDMLRRLGIPVVAGVPEVGRNFQNHFLVATRWPSRYDPALCSTIASAVAFVLPEDGRPTGCIFFAARPIDGKATVVMAAILIQPESRGRVALSGALPEDPVLIETNALQSPQDLARLVRLVQLCREFARSDAMVEVCDSTSLDGLEGTDPIDYVREHALPASHQCGTCRMGHDRSAVVDARLRVAGTSNVRVADASVLPRVTSGGTMAPCVLVGERAASFIKAAHGLA